MTAHLLTPAQARALRAVADGKVEQRRPWKSGRQPFLIAHADGVRRDTVERLIAMKLAVLGPQRGPSIYSSRPVALTAAGTAALDEMRQSDGAGS